jgi:membrane protein insertase Oxa1/YidC/SpoIIIJ
MQLQMKYAMPVIITFVAYTVSAAVALYFVVSNIMTIVQEYVVRARIPNRHKDITGA